MRKAIKKMRKVFKICVEELNRRVIIKKREILQKMGKVCKKEDAKLCWGRKQIVNIQRVAQSDWWEGGIVYMLIIDRYSPDK